MPTETTNETPAQVIPADLAAAYDQAEKAEKALAAAQKTKNKALERVAAANTKVLEVRPVWAATRKTVRDLEKRYGIGEFGSSDEPAQRIGG